MKKSLQYLLIAVAIAFVGYNSVYIKKLSAFEEKTKNQFDAAKFSQDLWDNEMPRKIDGAVGLQVLIKAVDSGKQEALENYTHALDIGNYRYSFVKTGATVTRVGEDEVSVLLPGGDSAIVATEFIYGNEIRDASGLIDIKKFVNISDLNGISAALDKIVRTSVLPPFKKAVTPGDKLEITAAIQLNKAHIDWKNMKLIPVRIQIVK